MPWFYVQLLHAKIAHETTVLDGHARWPYMTNTVERLCAAAMSLRESWQRDLFANYFGQS